MYLHRDDIAKIQEILDKFPEVETFEIKNDTSSGIGAHTTIVIQTKINDVPGEFETVISSVENW